MIVLAQTSQDDRFEQWRQAVQDQFQFGGTFISLVLAIFGLVLLIAITAWLSNRQRNRIDHGAAAKDPHRLYESLVARLEILPPQRSLLLRLAKDLSLSQPAVILLSESIYDQRISEWLEKHGPKDDAGLKADTDIFVKARSKLFPTRVTGVIGSQTAVITSKTSR